jgi:hypothetical protein
MRVRGDYYGYQVNDPCNPLYYGETEDYTVTIVNPVACAGTPAPGNTLSTSGQVCSGASFTLSLQNSFYAVTGLSYQWQSSPDGVTFTDISGATSSTYSASQTAATWYHCVVTCSNSALSANSSDLQVTMGFISCYCTPTYNYKWHLQLLPYQCFHIGNNLK